MPLPTVPARYMTGQNISSAVVAGYALLYSGALSALSFGGDLGSTGYLDDWEINDSVAAVQIQPINADVENFVPLQVGFDITVSEIRAADGSSFLAAIAYNCPIMSMSITTVDPTNDLYTYTETYFGMILGRNTNYNAEKNMVSVTMRPIGIGGNVVVTS